MISKEYLRLLRSYQNDFRRKYRIYFDPRLDPRIWLRSRDTSAELIWPKDILSQYEAFSRGECSSIDLVFLIYSPESRTEEKYVLAIKYKPYVSKTIDNNQQIFYPYKFSHSCRFCDFQLVSHGNIEIYCKHLYAALREADSIAKKYYIDGFTIAETMFYPRSEELFKKFHEVENSRISAEEKLKNVFTLLERELYVEELKLLERLNKRISHLRKI